MEHGEFQHAPRALIERGMRASDSPTAESCSPPVGSARESDRTGRVRVWGRKPFGRARAGIVLALVLLAPHTSAAQFSRAFILGAVPLGVSGQTDASHWNTSSQGSTLWVNPDNLARFHAEKIHMPIRWETRSSLDPT